MSKPLIAVTALMALTTLVHVFLGGPEYADSFRATLPADHLRSMAMVLWHAVTVNLIVFTCAYAFLSRHQNLPLHYALAAIQIGWSGLFLWYGATMLGSIWPMPQWVIFVMAPALAHWGHTRSLSR
ncbi:hypothetical protein [Aestuariibius sp. HNIBRBA575]|uniref:hypothetical protein n=1 Tax=Aestuariibius sp. HNIBRBA575 TaxID=3233343 RepID=UPI0034A10B51